MKSLEKHAWVALQRSHYFVFLIDEFGQVVEANAAAAASLGYSLSELDTLHMSDFDPAFESVSLNHSLETQSQEQPVTFESTHIRKDTSQYPVEVCLQCVSSTDSLYIAICQDITSRKQARLALEKESNRANHYMDIAGVLMVTLDLSGRITLLNRFACQLLEVNQSEAIGLNWFDEFLPEPDSSITRRAYNRLMAGTYEPNQKVERRVVTRSGDERLILWHNRVLYDDDGDRCGILSSGADITDNYLIGEQLSLVNEMVDHSLDPLICTLPEEDFRVVYANTAATEHFGVPAEHLYLTHLNDWDENYTLDELQQRWTVISGKKTVSRTTHRVFSGEEVPVEVSSRSFHFQNKAYMITVLKDLRGQFKSEQAVKLAEQRSQLLLQNTNEGIFGLDTEGVTTFINPAAAKMLGYEPSELIGKRIHSIIHHSHVNGDAMSEADCRMIMVVKDGQSRRVDTDHLWRKNGTSFPVEYWSSPIEENGEIVGAVITFHDISHRKAAEEQIRYLAFHDSLTGLPNRRLFLDRFSLELKQDKRTNQLTALLMLDVDHFKEVNDTLGHPVGDQLLVELAQRVGGVLREGDTFARLGGDEFAILQTGVTDLSDVAALAEKVIVSLREPIRFSDNKLKVNASIGIVICNPLASVDEHISKADIALYRAKERGRGCYVFYQADMTARVQRDAELAHMLSEARFLQQLYMVYQPQFDCVSGQLVGMEALIRWNHPKEGMISPVTFIPVAEKRGMIDDIGLWVAQSVSMEIARWEAEGLDFGVVSFNLSPVQLRNETGIEALLSILEESGVALNKFEVEITESACMDASEQALQLLENAVSKGLRLAIDDFGTGYSSMVALKKLSANRLKIDRSFVRDMLEDSNDEMIVNATIALAHSLNLEVVAEGVESAEQLKVLKQQSCDIVQGFLLGYPMNASDATNFLRILGEKVQANPVNELAG